MNALGLSATGVSWDRQNAIRILFVHRSQEVVERCLIELRRMRFTVAFDTVVNSQQFSERLRAQHYDLVVAELPTTHWKEPWVLGILTRTNKKIPIIFLVERMSHEAIAGLILKGVADCVELDNIGHLPVAVHRALDSKSLREQRDHAEKELTHSRARYRALAGNQSYGVCHCDADGKLLEVNETMLAMLGYGSIVELRALDYIRDIIQNPELRSQLLGLPGANGSVIPVELEWKRKDHSPLRVKLTGKEVCNEERQLEAYEVIVEDVTEQRELENQLRREAASDLLTGLANYRQLVDVLNSEIKRSQRTNRPFALLFFDLDGLKFINDRYGHMVGNYALRRVADSLSSCCRSIDTPARYGGDEFALVLLETNVEEASHVAQRVCQCVADDPAEPKLSVSFGVAVYPQSGGSIERLLAHADSELYSMKRKKAPPQSMMETKIDLPKVSGATP